MADRPWSGGPAGVGMRLVGRDAAGRRLERAVERGPGALVAGPEGVGVSALLREVVATLRCRGRSVRHEVAPGPAGLVGTEPADGLPPDPRNGVSPSLLVLDDAHRLGDSSAERLRAAVLAGRLHCVLGTTALDDAPPALDWLWQSGTLERVDLTALGGDALAEWVTELVGAPPDPPTVEALLRDGGGLPGLTVDTLHALVDPEGRTEGWGGSDTTSSLVVRCGYARLTGELPCAPALRDRVTARIEALADEDRAALVAVCVTGRLEDRADRRVVAPTSRDRLIRGGLVRPDRTRLGHPSLVPSIGAVRRIVLERLGPGGVASVAARLLDTAAPVSDAERELWAALSSQPASAPTVEVIRHLIEQGRVDEAIVLARLASDRGDGAATILLSELLADRGDRVAAARLLDDLLEADSLPTSVEIGATAELAYILLWDLGERDRAVQLARRLCERTGGARGPAGPVLLVITTHSGQVDDAVTLVDQLHLPDWVRDHVTFGAAALAVTLAGQTERGVVLAEEGLAWCAAATGDGPAVGPESTVLSLSVALTEAGRIDDADALARRWYERARGRPGELAWMALARARLELARGNLDAADARAREAEGIFAAVDASTSLRWAVATQVFTAGLRGDPAAARAHLDRLGSLPPSAVGFFDADIARAVAWAMHAVGDTPEARRLLCDAAQRAEAVGNHTLATHAWHDAFRLGDRERAAAGALSAAARVDGTWSTAVVDHVRAVLGGNAAAALAAARACRAAGRHLEAAEVAAIALERAVHQGDRRLVRDASAVLAQVGAICRGAATPLLRAAGTFELTEREREVAEMAAAGATSRGIAEELSISVRTVDNLLGRVYAKLGLGGRRDLAGALTGGARR